MSTNNSSNSAPFVPSPQSNLAQIKGRIVVVDDDNEMRSLLEDFFTNQNYSVVTFSNGAEALDALSPGGSLSLKTPASATDASGFTSLSAEIDVVISDIRMPQLDGLEFTTRLKLVRPEIPTILITAFGSIETAIEAMQKGAFNYVVKPFKLSEMTVNVERAVEHRHLHRENQTLRQEVKKSWAYGNLIGKSVGMKSVFDLISRVSSATANILITGESGTGKEMVARSIHDNGPRKHKPFVAINCTAIPESLLESELFGHAKGSFTGAISKKRGLFEEAEGGTLFLDEIGDMNVALQSKLLRVVQERKVRPVGDNTSHDIDVRIIAATHKDLKLAIKEERFREDLYYRLSVIPVVIPPLRHRKEDIPILAEHFLKKYSATNLAKVKGFTRRAIQKLMNMSWEGNVRELENVIERAVVLATTHLIDDRDLPTADTVTPEEFFAVSSSDFPSLNQLEARYMKLVLEKTGGRKDKAAHILGINRRTLYRKEREYGFVSFNSPETLEEADPEFFESENQANLTQPLGAQHPADASVSS